MKTQIIKMHTQNKSSKTTVSHDQQEFKNVYLFEQQKYYLNNETAVVHFVIEIDGHIASLVPAHKIVLASRSPVFHQMFYGGLKEGNQVKIVDTSVKGFEDFLSIFYCDTIQITNENVADFTNLCNKYDVQHGLDMCESFEMKNIKTGKLCSKLALAIKFNLEKLQALCEKKIQTHADIIFKLDDFIECDSDTLKVILQQGHHNACKENDFDENDEQNLRQVLGECFY